MSNEHPIKQVICKVVVFNGDEANRREVYETGTDVTRIEATTKSGMYADIPYIRIWKHDKAFAEFCQHDVVGVYFSAAALPPDPAEDLPF